MNGGTKVMPCRAARKPRVTVLKMTKLAGETSTAGDAYDAREACPSAARLATTSATCLNPVSSRKFGFRP